MARLIVPLAISSIDIGHNLVSHALSGSSYYFRIGSRSVLRCCVGSTCLSLSGHVSFVACDIKQFG